MLVRFWGVRGSSPAPLLPSMVRKKMKAAVLAMAMNKADVMNEKGLESLLDAIWPFGSGTAGGNTPCVEVRAGRQFLILDAGSGLRELGLRLMLKEFARGKGVAHLLLSHTHWDHIIGLPFFAPLYVAGNEVHIHSPHQDIEERIRPLFQPANFPVPWDVAKRTLIFHPMTPGGEERFGRITVRNIKLHHPGDSFGFRVEQAGRSVVYATDSEYKDLSPEAMQPFWDFFRNADALIFDAQYTLSEAVEKEDWGHSSAVVGVDVALAAGARRLVLFHHEPTYDDNQLRQILEKARLYLETVAHHPNCEILCAYEGMEISL